MRQQDHTEPTFAEVSYARIVAAAAGICGLVALGVIGHRAAARCIQMYRQMALPQPPVTVLAARMSRYAFVVVPAALALLLLVSQLTVHDLRTRNAMAALVGVAAVGWTLFFAFALALPFIRM